MISTGTARPRQKLPFTKKDKDWRLRSMQYFTYANSQSANQRKGLEVLYKLANGYLDESEYDYVLNPLGEEGKKNPQYQSFPAKLRNWDIISPIVHSLVGQMIEMGLDYTVIDQAADIETEHKTIMSQLVKVNMLKKFNNALLEIGIDTGRGKEEERPVPEMEEEAKSIGSLRSKEGRKMLDYIVSYNELLSKYLRCFYDFIVTGTCFTRRDVLEDETIFEDVSPLNVRYLASQNVNFLEDGESISVDYFMNPSEVIDFFYGQEEFTEEMIDYIELQDSGTGSTGEKSYRATDYYGTFKDRFINKISGSDNAIPKVDGNIRVTHTNFTSFTRVGRLSYKDILGNEYIEEVSEEFKPMKGEKVEWIWVKQIWEGFSINDKFWLGIAPIPLQRGSLDNPNKCKLLYNGKILDSRSVEAKSIVQKAKVYQEKYNIIQYNIEMTINKNMDKVILMPLSLVPDDEDMDMFGQMYYTKAMGYMYFDDSDKAKLQAAQHIRVLDTNLNQYINYLYTIAQQIKMEFEQQVGFTRQSKGEINSSDSVRNTQEAIFRGNLMTSYLFEQFRQLQQRDLQALLDLSKFAFIEGKKANYLNSVGRQEWLKLEPYSVTQTSYGLFVKNSAKELKMRDEMKMRAQEFAQNGSTPSDVAKILRSESFDELEEYLENKEKEIQEANAQQAQADRELEKYKQESENYNKTEDRKIKEDDSIRRSETALKIALINSQSSIQDTLPSLEGEDKTTALALISDMNLKIRELGLKEKDSQRKAAATKYKADKDLEIAKENKNKYEV
jgi:hypothetical protein